MHSRFVFLIGMLLLALGCGGTPANERKLIDIKEVPPAVMEVAKKNLPQVKTWTKAWKEPNGTIEVRGKNEKGKEFEIDIKPDLTFTIDD